MKVQFSQRQCEDSEEISLLKDIEKTKFALETAYRGFDYVTEPDLIDSYIYEVNAIQKRYKYLLEQAAKQCLPPEKQLCPEAPVASLVV